MSNIVTKIKTIIFNMNERGIPLPLLRDPNKDAPSITMTMMVISFAIAAGGVIGKLTKVLGAVDASAANYLFLTAAGLYLGRRITSDGTKTEIEKEDKE